MTLSPFKRRFKGPEFTLVLDEGQHKDGELIKIGTLREVTEDFWLVSSPRKISNPISENLMKNFKWKT